HRQGAWAFLSVRSLRTQAQRQGDDRGRPARERTGFAKSLRLAAPAALGPRGASPHESGLGGGGDLAARLEQFAPARSQDSPARTAEPANRLAKLRRCHSLRMLLPAPTTRSCPPG